VVASPSLESQRQVFRRISSAFPPVLNRSDTGLHEDFGQRDSFPVVSQETVLNGNLIEARQNNATRRRHQLLGGNDPPGG
jgi:hypothetical protein